MVHDTRELNRSAVLSQLLRTRPASRKQIAQASGISPATVTRAVEQLIAEGIVHESSELISDQRGRRAVLLDVVADRALAVGVDLGASNTRMLLADFAGTTLDRNRTPTPVGADAETLAMWLVERIRELAGDRLARVGHVCIGLPGAVRDDGRTITNAPNLAQVEGPVFLARVEALLGIGVTADNDANLALLGEQRFGAAQGHPTSVMITVGAGLGAGIAIDGTLLRGSNGIIGEFGQLPAGPLGTRLELLVTGPGLMRLAAEAGVAIDSPTALFRPDAPEPVQRLRSHFDHAMQIVLTAAAVSCDPSVIVLGGGIAESLAPHLGRYQEALRAQLGSDVRILATALGEFGGALGGAVAALHRLYLEIGVDATALGEIPHPARPEGR
ncbi:MAG: ROK family transcriptional regulator [Actinobacteria bacterium]|nr:ROK family transcriptional regulator [Actinomycetota bacterium]